MCMYVCVCRSRQLDRKCFYFQESRPHHSTGCLKFLGTGYFPHAAAAQRWFIHWAEIKFFFISFNWNQAQAFSPSSFTNTRGHFSLYKGKLWGKTISVPSDVSKGVSNFNREKSKCQTGRRPELYTQSTLYMFSTRVLVTQYYIVYQSYNKYKIC